MLAGPQAVKLCPCTDMHLMKAFMLSKMLRPSRTAATIVLKLSSASTMSLASFATSVPAIPIATPMSASFRAGASLTPSPVIATTSCAARSCRTTSCLSRGSAREMQRLAPLESAARWRSTPRAAKSRPVKETAARSVAGVKTPMALQIASAVFLLSPASCSLAVMVCELMQQYE